MNLEINLARFARNVVKWDFCNNLQTLRYWEKVLSVENGWLESSQDFLTISTVLYLLLWCSLWAAGVQFSISKLCNSLFEATFSVVVRTNVHRRRIVHTSLVPLEFTLKSPADNHQITPKWAKLQRIHWLISKLISIYFSVDLNRLISTFLLI